MTDGELRQARQTDLLSYLRSREPWELVRVSGDVWCTREHDSLKISNGKWYWFSRGFGGTSALDYLVKVRGMSLAEAAEAVLGSGAAKEPAPGAKKTPKEFAPPEKSACPDRAVSYLRGRGIHPAVIGWCLDNGLLYESAKHSNAVFVGKDESGEARYAAVRGTSDGFKAEAPGSDKSWSFRIEGRGGSAHLHVFESAIDLMSWATMAHMCGGDWRRDGLLSLGGVHAAGRGGGPPASLKRYLAAHPGISTVHLHLDNDEAGRRASRDIAESLRGRVKVLDEPPARGKDVNERLLMRLGKTREREEAER